MIDIFHSDKLFYEMVHILFYSKSYDFVPLPLPSCYRRVTVALPSRYRRVTVADLP